MMDTVDFGISLLAGVVVGSIGTWLILRLTQIQYLNSLKSQIARIAEELEKAQAESSDLLHSKIRLESEIGYLNQKLEDQQERAKENEKQLAEQFENLSNKLLKSQTEDFNKHSSERLGELLNPVTTLIKDFGKAIVDHREVQIKEQTSLKEQIRALTNLNAVVTEETRNLTNALKGESKTRGNWGEMILEVILDRSGLKKDEHYSVQKKYLREDGEGKGQPDVVLHLPDGKNLIIDSKVVLLSYENAMNADSDEERHAAFQAHTQAIRRHIELLSNQEYEKLYGINSPDFVFLFTPVEGALQAALQIDSDLYAFAISRNVALTSPTMLIATLKIVQNIWKQDAQNQNALLIAETGRKLYDKLTGFVTDLEGVGNSLDKAKSLYDSAFSKLSKGRGNALGIAEKLKELGVETKKSLPVAENSDGD